MIIRLILLALVTLLFSTLAVAQLPYTEQGLVERLENFPSKYIEPRHIDIWTPEGYDKTKKYPVVYMHDGQMLFDSTNTWNHQEWRVDEIVSTLISEQKIKPCIVVGIHSSSARHAEYFPQKAFDLLPLKIKEQYLTVNTSAKVNSQFSNSLQSDNYINFIVEELKPYIDLQFSTETNSANTFVIGSSMGGLISMYAMFEYPTVFGGAGCVSTHWIGGQHDYENPIPAAFLHYMNQNIPNHENHKIYFDHGTEGLDAMYTIHQLNINDAMRDAGFVDNKNLKTRVYEGHDHNAASWTLRLDEVFTFLMSN